VANPHKSKSMAELKAMIAQARAAINAMPQGRLRDNRTARLDLEERRLFGTKTIADPSQLAST
jgi:hypothetical protein